MGDGHASMSLGMTDAVFQNQFAMGSRNRGVRTLKRFSRCGLPSPSIQYAGLAQGDMLLPVTRRGLKFLLM
jgi:hypothetical protein